MSSIKCNHCGLVNFVDQSHCKRCQNQINNLTQIVKERNYQFENTVINNSSSSDNFSSQNSIQGDENKYCLKCGKEENLTFQTFNKKYVSPVASLGIFLGILPYFLLRVLLSTTHTITSPFCDDCWNKFKNFELYSALLTFSSAMIFILSLLISGVFDYLPILLLGISMSIISFILGRIYIAKISPKFKKVNEKEVIINSPIVGEIVYTK